MNRTQRAIKKSYRESEKVARDQKNKMIEKRKHSNRNDFLESKSLHNESVKRYAKEEKEMKALTRDFKRRAKSDKEGATV